LGYTLGRNGKEMESNTNTYFQFQGEQLAEIYNLDMYESLPLGARPVLY